MNLGVRSLTWSRTVQNILIFQNYQICRITISNVCEKIWQFCCSKCRGVIGIVWVYFNFLVPTGKRTVLYFENHSCCTNAVPSLMPNLKHVILRNQARSLPSFEVWVNTSIDYFNGNIRAFPTERFGRTGKSGFCLRGHHTVDYVNKG